MKIIDKAANYQREQNLLIKNNSDEIEHINQKLALTIMTLGCFAFIPFIFIALLVESYNPLFWQYVMEAVVLLLLLLIFQKLKNRLHAAMLIYIVSIILSAYAIYSSVFIYPNQICILMSFILFQVPIIVVDKSWRVNLFVLILVGVYIAAVILYKMPQFLLDEIFNCLLFSIFGMILGKLLQHAQLENFELKRQAVMKNEKDFLTGLYRRDAAEHMIAKILERDTDTDRIHTLIVFDIDDFKNINDKYGHAFGDTVIRGFAAEIQAQFCDSDIVGRVGGDEFVTLVLDFESIFILREQLSCFCKNITKKNFGLADGDYISGSVGVALFPKHGKTYSELFEKVDEALYYAKAQGKSSFHIFGASIEGDTSFRLDGREVKNVLENTTDGIAKYAYVEKLKLLYFNKKLADLAGGETGAISSPDFDAFSYIHPEDLAKLQTTLQNVLQNRASIDEVFRLKHLTKEYVLVRLRGYFVNELYQDKYLIFYAVYTDLSTLPIQREVVNEINSN